MLFFDLTLEPRKDFLLMMSFNTLVLYFLIKDDFLAKFVLIYPSSRSLPEDSIRLRLLSFSSQLEEAALTYF